MLERGMVERRGNDPFYSPWLRAYFYHLIIDPFLYRLYTTLHYCTYLYMYRYYKYLVTILITNYNNNNI